MPVKVNLKVIEIWNNDSMENAVRAYEEEGPQPKGQIVFYGPSYFTRWSDKKHPHRPMADDLLGASGAKCVINRGFGSSSAEHQLYYYDRMVRPLAPRVLVYNCTNGNGGAFGYTWEENWELSQRVIAYAMTDFPGLHVYLEGAGISPKGKAKGDIEHRKECNKYLEEFAANTPGVTYVDKMNYTPMHCDDIFVADGVHYNQEGYDLYADFFREVLKDELAKY
jgi:hypothetical protein